MTMAPETSTEAAAADLAGGGLGAAVSGAHRQAERSRGTGMAANLIPPLLMGAVLIGLWYFVSYVILDEGRRFLLEPPHEVLNVGFLDWANFSEILLGLWSSTRVAMIGLGISIILGFVPVSYTHLTLPTTPYV